MSWQRRLNPRRFGLGTASAVAVVLLAPGTVSASTRHRSHTHRRPTLKQLIATYIARRPGATTAAVYDVKTGQRWAVNWGMRNDTGSIVKVDILETRLHQTHGHLSDHDRQLASAMIEQSDNDAATALWNADGGDAGVGRYNGEVGMRCTTLGQNGYWGLTLTCATDQLRLLKRLAQHNRLLTDRSRRYQLYLMKHVISGEAWGVSAGVPRRGVSVALKNGWLPYGDAPWIVNSIGVIHGDDRYYYISVLTRDPTEGDGIATIEGISRLVWRKLPRHERVVARLSVSYLRCGCPLPGRTIPARSPRS